MKRPATGWLEIIILVLLLLAVTLPFINQAIHVDAHLFIDWAKQGLNYPLWQHLPDYDYFGVHYDEFHDTHPRLHSLFLTLLLKLTGEVSEPIFHLAAIIFPVAGVIAMYHLSRRFGAYAFLATLLFLVSPAFLVNMHMIMTDVPGISLWLVGLAFFIHGVDKEKLISLVLAALFFTLTIFTYYQGLSVLPLAFLYLLLYRKVSARTLLPLSIPVILFLVYISVHFSYYGQPPTFSYPFGLPVDPLSVTVRVKGVTTLIGGAIIFPLAALVIFLRNKWISYAAVSAGLLATWWAASLYLKGTYSVDALFIMPLLLTGGVAVSLVVMSRFRDALIKSFKGEGGQDESFLCIWFLGTLFYCAILLPYPSPRYLIPLVPPLAIFTSREIEKLWGFDRRKFVVAITLIVSSTLALGLVVAVGEHQRANNNRIEAEWVEKHYPPDGHVWFNGGLGYQYYLERKGYPMVMIDGEGLQTGDYIIESVGNNRWYFDANTVFRLELVDQVDFPREWPVTTEYYIYRTSWLGQIGMVIPYGFQGEYLDRLYIYRVALTEEEEYSCRVIYD